MCGNALQVSHNDMCSAYHIVSHITYHMHYTHHLIIIYDICSAYHISHSIISHITYGTCTTHIIYEENSIFVVPLHGIYKLLVLAI